MNLNPYRLTDTGHTFFATRAFAADIYGLIAEREADTEGPIVVDFTGVEAITGAFADELVAKLVAQFAERVVVEHANDDIAATIATALERRGIQKVTDVSENPGRTPAPVDGE